MYFFFPETAKLTLEEISAVFGDEVAVVNLGRAEEEGQGLGRKVKKPGLDMENGSMDRDLRGGEMYRDGATEKGVQV